MKQGIVLWLFSVLIFTACQQKNENAQVPVIGFADAFEDETLAQAKKGFFKALEDNGYSEKKKNIKVLSKNAQGDIPALTQIMNFFVAENVSLIAANATLTTITAVQKTKDIPVFMMVAGTPENMKLTDDKGLAPKNLLGVGETLDYIDTSFLLIQSLLTPASGKLKVGMIYNQSEPQSVDALKRITDLAAKNNIDVIALPVNASADAQLVTQNLLSKNIDAFFANPDNTVFASFETILKNCSDKKVPVFTSEAGLVKRGAVAAYGADIYQWGYQAGVQAAKYLQTGSLEGMKPELVQIRKKVFNPQKADIFGIKMPAGFEPL